MAERELRRIVLKEEFVALTGNYIKAIILAQLEYWQKRAKEFDKFIEEEKERTARENIEIKIKPTHGWIYKSAQDLSSETMLGLSKSRIRFHLKDLISMGYVLERPNPYYKWDRTMQYRLDLLKIKKDLSALGFELQEWKFDISDRKHTSSKIELRGSVSKPLGNDEDEETEEPGSVTTRKHTSSKIEHRELKNRTSKFQNRTAIPEIINRDYNISTPPLIPPLTPKRVQRETSLINTNNKIISEDLRSAVYREHIFEVYDNLSDIKPLDELVKEGALRACKDMIVNRVALLTENGIKIRADHIAEQVKTAFPYDTLPKDEKRKRKSFVATVCNITAEKILLLFNENQINN